MDVEIWSSSFIQAACMVHALNRRYQANNTFAFSESIPTKTKLYWEWSEDILFAMRSYMLTH